MRLKISREQEAANRLERIKLAIDKGITGNIQTGEVFNSKGGLITGKCNGYTRIRFNHNRKQVIIYAHQFIYYLATGIVDYGIGFSLDHNNRNKDDNRISNLSIESDSNQARNRGSYENAKGCTWFESLQKWQARIKVNGKPISLGFFLEYEDARKAYLDAKLNIIF